jgi:hypothetical protein
MTIPENVVSDLTTSTASIFNGSQSVILLAMGIVVAFYIVRSIIDMIPKIR